MPRRLPTLTLAVAATLVVFVIVRAARGDESPAKGVNVEVPAQPFQTVVVHPFEKGVAAVEGVLQLTSVSLRTETGTRVIDLRHVRRVTFQRDPEGGSQDTVELATKEIVRGRVTDGEFPVKLADGTVRVLKKETVREIKVERARDLSLATALIALVTLAAMEIVLGIDNIIFLAIIAAKLPEKQQPKARRIGLIAALGTRLILLFTLTWILGLTAPLFTLPDLPLLHDLESREVSGRDLILLAGGLFLIGKSVREMHEKLEHAKAGPHAPAAAAPGRPVSFASTIATIAVIDIVFSLDSVITAVGMVDQLWVMVAGMVIAMGVMLVFAEPIARFVDKHPTIKVLALSFLILIGVMLVAEGLGQHIDKGYIYFAMAFAVGIEMINMRMRKPHKAEPAPA